MVEPVTAPDSDRPVGDRPPPALINGVPGKPVSWCWGSACVDGFVNSPAILPEAEPPFEVEVIEGAVIEGASAIGPPGPEGITDRERTEVALDGTTLAAIPDDAEMLSIVVRFANGGCELHVGGGSIGLT